MWYVCDVLYAVLYVCVCYFVVRGCAVSRRYIDVCYCDVFSVVNVYLDHLMFCVVCSSGCCCCSPSETYGRKWGDSNFQILTELPVPPQAAGVVGTF